MILLDPEARPVIAHRGAAGQYPENTELAFDQALVGGADALEMDVRLTADSVAVVLHDSTVDRTTNGSGPVGAMSLDGLQRLDAGAGQSVPTLEQVLDRYAETPILLEIKERGAGEAVRRLLDRHNAWARTLVGAFELEHLTAFRDGPYHRTAARREVAIFWASAVLRIPRGAVPYEAFSVPEYHGRLEVVTERFVRLASRVGVPVHVWVVDDPARAAKLRAKGVAGILTEFPERMRDLGAWNEERDGLPFQK